MRADRNCQCTRCKNKHLESERISKPRKGDAGVSEMCCPCCNCRSFYDITPAVAWCWASGEIEYGDVAPASSPDGQKPTVFAHGPHCDLVQKLKAVSRRDIFRLFVPGVAEAQDVSGKTLEFRLWLNRIAAGCNGHRLSRGVVFELQEASV